MNRSIILRLFVVYSLTVAAAFAATGVILADDTSPDESKVTSYKDVLSLLKKSGMKYQANEESMSAIFATEAGEFKGTMLIRWDEKAGIMQLIQFMPLEVPQDRIPAVESALARANHVLPLPGIGLDHKSGRVYFRMSVVFRPRGSLQANEINAFIWATLQQAASFHKPLTRVALENADPAGILADIEQEANNRKPTAVR